MIGTNVFSLLVLTVLLPCVWSSVSGSFDVVRDLTLRYSGVEEGEVLYVSFTSHKVMHSARLLLFTDLFAEDGLVVVSGLDESDVLQSVQGKIANINTHYR